MLPFKMTYTLTEERKKQFAGLYLLERMINRPESFPLFLEKHDQDLEPILEYLLTFKYIEIKEKKDYIPTIKGREIVQKFLERYRDFLQNFDIYSTVDLNKGVFAFASYWEFNSEMEWKNYVHQEGWEDLRVAVAEFKQIDPIEIVFMSFLYEGRFGWSEASGWQFDLLLGSIWEEILAIVNSALKQNDLGYESGDEKVSGQEVLQDIISQGAKLNEQLWSEEDDRNMDIHYHGDDLDDDPNDGNYYLPPIKGESTTNGNHRLYRDPHYVNPCWGFIFFI